MQVSFRANIPKTISPIYKTKTSKRNTIVVLGSSKSAESITKYMEMCSNTVKGIVLSGKNVLHGCCTKGIMGAAYLAGMNYSAKNKDGKPLQNLAIVTDPLWGDEDLENCVTIGSANGESDRIEKFAEVADSMLIFPGGTGTLQEAATLISKNHYGKKEDRKKIILIGREFFSGLDAQYHQLYKAGLIKHPPEELYTIVDSEEEIKNLV